MILLQTFQIFKLRIFVVAIFSRSIPHHKGPIDMQKQDIRLRQRYAYFEIYRFILLGVNFGYRAAISALSWHPTK